MKKFKIVSNVMIVVAVSLFVLGIILSVVSTEAQETIFLALIEANALLIAGAGIGAFLLLAKNDTAKKVGAGLLVVGFATGLICALGTLNAISQANLALGEDAEETIGTSIGAIIMIVSTALLLLHYAFLLVAHILNKGRAIENPCDDIRIVQIKEWKQLMEEEIITKEEFEEKRVQLLGIKPKNDKAN